MCGVRMPSDCTRMTMDTKTLINRIRLTKPKITTVEELEASPADIRRRIEMGLARDKRDTRRVATYKDSFIKHMDGRRERCVIRDMSETGVRVGCAGAGSLPEYCYIHVFNENYLVRVVWRTPFDAGLEYCLEE